jgi:Raf kinase inhibitor-like YbhB/YbcL family protein
MEFKLTSPAFSNGMQIPSKYTCDGENISPHLFIHGHPEKTRSLALVMTDQDAPAEFAVHWIVWNISPEVGEIKEHSVPHGAGVGLNGRGKCGYNGPCPQSGVHRYLLRLYALDTKLKLADNVGRLVLEAALESHVLATTELMGTYSRTNEAPL